MGRLGVTIFSRPLRYRNQTVNLPDGTKHTILVGQEKGIDVRVALDIVRLANEDSYDFCRILSQDQDLTEAVDEVKLAARKQNRWIKVACAFPTSPTFRNNRGIDKTDWIRKQHRAAHRPYRPTRMQGGRPPADRRLSPVPGWHGRRAAVSGDVGSRAVG